jgi:hypothetical protein
MTATTIRTAALGALALAAIATTGCGAVQAPPMHPVAATAAAPVRVTLLSPHAGARTSASQVTVRGTVTPAGATVLVQGKPATVGNGVFVATASVHRGRTRIDVIASARDATPASASMTISRPRIHHAAAKSPTPQPVSVTVVSPAQATCATAGCYGATSCGGDLAVGPNTTCPFAVNVRAAYEQHGPGTVLAYSPVTHRTYAMTCVDRAPVVCTGGNAASVYFG